MKKDMFGEPRILKLGDKEILFVENNKMKIARSPDYNFNFNKETGFFMRWGKTMDDDPDFAPAPEILDIEISTICNPGKGKNGGGGGCSFCYKSNTANGINMSLETFKTIFDKMPPVLTQIALGIGSLNTNPDLYKIMDYCRTNGRTQVIPNITINGAQLTDEHADKLASLIGGMAISHYDDDICYNAVKKMTDLTDKKINIHQLLSEETLDDCYRVMNDYLKDPRLEKLGSVVFLIMKPKGKRNNFHVLRSLDKYKAMIEFAFENNIPIGFDSCSAPSFLKVIKGSEREDALSQVVESCESDCFSSYINTEGRYYHCSFTENEDGWKGIDVVNCEDFITDVWNSPEANDFRKKLYANVEKDGCRSCPIFNLDMD